MTIKNTTETKPAGRRGRKSKAIEPVEIDVSAAERITPADNAGVDVIDEMRAEVAGSRTVGERRADDRRERPRHYEILSNLVLPNLPGGDQTRIGNIAQTFHESGYFGDLTPAQIATHILAGQSLGLDPARSVFDLEISKTEDGPKIRYRPGQPLQAAGDVKDATDASIKNTGDRATPEPASAAADRDNVVKMPPAGRIFTINPADQITVTPGPIAVPGPIPADEPAENPDLANKGDLSVPGSEGPQGPGPGPAEQTGVTEPGKAGGFEPGQPSPIAEGLADVLTAKQIGLIKSGARSAGVDAEKECFAMFGTEISTLTKRAAGDLIDHFADLIAEPRPVADDPAPLAEALTGAAISGDPVAGGLVEPDPGSATPEPASPAADPGPIPAAIGAAGDETPLVIATWRAGLALVCDQLGINRDEKLKTFDAETIGGKRKMYEDSQKYYETKVEAVREFVLNELTADGKPDNETRKGFFMYAEVGLDPDKWTYLEASRAQNAVAQFVGKKPAA